MRRYFWRALRAQLRGGRALFALAVAGVALGVGAVLSIQILNGSALGAFGGSVRAISGDAQLSIVGRGPALPDALVVEVLGEEGVRAAVPIIGRNGEILAALAIQGPEARMNVENARAHLPALRRAARDLAEIFQAQD